jgi:DNA repair exonuclease SbcCD ATPase subunit
MPDNETDSGQTGGTAENTNSTSSAGEGGKQSSFDAQKLQSTLEALAKRLDEVDARSKALQGDKDRGVNKANNEVDVLKKKIAELEKLRKAGYDDDTALEEMSFRDSVQEVKAQIANLKAASAGNGAVDVAKVVESFKLSKDDPNIVAHLAGRAFKSEAEVEVAMARYVQGQINKPAPSEADKSSVPSNPPPKDGDVLSRWESVKGHPGTPEYNKVVEELRRAQ